jgi:hypothetical protein
LLNAFLKREKRVSYADLRQSVGTGGEFFGFFITSPVEFFFITISGAVVIKKK